MNWYKKQSNIRQALSRLTKPDMEGVSKDRQKLFNYLKTLNIKHTFYHGTSTLIYKSVLKNGYMYSPIALDSADEEKRFKGLDQVFYTTSPRYALVYASRTARQTDSDPVILELEIPVHLITEVKNAILFPDVKGYNEYKINKTFNEIMHKELSERGIEEIINHELFSAQYEATEFTTYMALPSKYIINASGNLDDVNLDFETNKWSEKLKNIESTFVKDNIVPNEYWNSVPQELKDYDYQRLLKSYFEGVKNLLTSFPQVWDLPQFVSYEIKQYNYDDLFQSTYPSFIKYLQTLLDSGIVYDIEKLPKDFMIPEIMSIIEKMSNNPIEQQKTPQQPPIEPAIIPQASGRSWYKK
jgi:hypothetical protein